MSSGSSDPLRRAGLLAVAVALAAAIAAAGARLARRGSAGSNQNAYTCRCGKSYRVSGTDRHRVYWPADAPEDAPVLGDRCVECGAALAAPRPRSGRDIAPRSG